MMMSINLDAVSNDSKAFIHVSLTDSLQKKKVIEKGWMWIECRGKKK